jgi:type I restriction enzyme M protein
MELKELCEKTMELFGISTISELSNRLMENVLNEDKETSTKLQSDFVQIVGGDLSKDWMQKIFQYYCADRKDKKQDYTPTSVAKVLGMLAGNKNHCIDLCAGSGALTIQKWNINHDIYFELYEFDENVIPYLLFNMAVRKINCMVYHADVLQMEIFKSYKIQDGIVTEA